jgi:response regulator RpfG family c-di-GMP phosphodiesterase
MADVSESGVEQTLRFLIIEDNDDDVQLILRELRRANGFRIIHEAVATEAKIRQALTQKSWDFVISDYFLQGFDAPRVSSILEHLGIDIPFILVSGKSEEEMADAALRIRGVYEYVSKKRLYRLGPLIHRALRHYEGYDQMIRAWASALELRDLETRGHSDRVVERTVQLARAMEIAESEIVHIRRGALLHDIGKLGVPDSILLKKGPLTDEEMERMKTHSLIGFEFLRKIKILERALEIPLHHHERWNGSGYPLGLQGIEIPLAARIFAVVDVYDALTSERPYREAWVHQVAMDYIRSESAKSFDPQVVKKFVELVGDG